MGFFYYYMSSRVGVSIDPSWFDFTVYTNDSSYQPMDLDLDVLEEPEEDDVPDEISETLRRWRDRDRVHLKAMHEEKQRLYKKSLEAEERKAAHLKSEKAAARSLERNRAWQLKKDELKAQADSLARKELKKREIREAIDFLKQDPLNANYTDEELETIVRTTRARAKAYVHEQMAAAAREYKEQQDLKEFYNSLAQKWFRP